MATVLLFFALGLVRDALGALYYLAISRNREYGASGLAGIITCFDLFVLAAIIYSWTIPGALAYACGNAAGTLIALRLGNKR